VAPSSISAILGSLLPVCMDMLYTSDPSVIIFCPNTENPFIKITASNINLVF